VTGTWDGSATAILPVAFMGRAIAFYRAIGFEVERYSGGEYAFATAQRTRIDLSVTDRYDPFSMAGSVYVTVSDADAVHTSILAAGMALGRGQRAEADLRERWTRGESIARITEPADTSWGMREFALMDPDNNLLRIGHPLQ
jgi:catechol 2,3-dioxygenase-like lactoylglutathione lyase family enzyme